MARRPLAVVGRPAPRKYGPERVRGEARYTADLKLPGMLAGRRSPLAARAREGAADRPRAGARAAGRASRDRPRRGARARGGGRLRGRCGRRRRGGHLRPGTSRCSRRSTSNGRSSRSCSIPTTPSSASSSPPSRAPTSAARSTRRSPTRTSWSRGRTARRPSSTTRWRRIRRSASGRATRSTCTSRHSSSGAIRQAVAQTLETARGQGAGRVRVHGRRLRLEERPRRVHVRRGRAREADRTAGALRADAARGEHLGRQPQRHDPAAPGRRPQRRDDRRVRGRVHELGRLVGLERLDRGADANALRLRERPHRHLRRQAQHAADEGVPRARLRRGDVRPRVSHRRAGGEARRRPARAAAAQLRGLERGHALLVQEPRGLLPERRAALGAAARGAFAVRRGLEARRRDGEPDLVRRRRASLVRMGATRLRRASDRDHGDAGHRYRHAHRDGADRGRGARHPAGPCRRRARRLGARAVRLDLRRLVDVAVDGAGGARGGSRRARADRGHRRAARACQRTRRCRRSSTCWRSRRSSARARAGRTRLG